MSSLVSFSLLILLKIQIEPLNTDPRNGRVIKKNNDCVGKSNPTFGPSRAMSHETWGYGDLRVSEEIWYRGEQAAAAAESWSVSAMSPGSHSSINARDWCVGDSENS